MKTTVTVAVLVAAAVSVAAADPPQRDRFAKNLQSAGGAPRILHAPDTPQAGGLAPSTWGFAAFYSGSLFGTGYYPFRVDRTSGGVDSIYGFTYNYPSAGFANEIRAIYVFDVSGLSGLPGPVFSSFMFDTRERPAFGAEGVSAFASVTLNTSSAKTTIDGVAFFDGNNARHLDIYDAEDFENGSPFSNPAAAFSGNNTLIGTVPVVTASPMPFSLDVSNALGADAGLLNGSFEAGGTTLRPAFWKPNDFDVGDGLACNKGDAFDGQCAVRMQGEPFSAIRTEEGYVYLRQVIPIGGSAGDSWTFSAAAKSTGAASSGKKKFEVAAKFKGGGGGNEVQALKFDRGTHGYQLLSRTFNTTSAYTSILIEVRYFGHPLGSEALFDGISLTPCGGGEAGSGSVGLLTQPTS